MTFLELCNKVRSLGAMQGTGPLTVVNQTGEYNRVVDWVIDAWTQIQLEFDGKWRFLKSDFSKNTIIDTQNYEFYTADGVVNFDNDSFKLYLPSEGIDTKVPLRYVGYKKFRDTYLDNSDSGKPYIITVTPDYNLRVYPKPDNVYTILADSYDQPVMLSADSDEPAIHVGYHMIIVYRALMMYAGYEEATSVYNYASGEHDKLYNRMIWDQLDEAENMVVRPQ